MALLAAALGALLWSGLASADDVAVKLNNGVAMPKIAFAASLWDEDTCRDATSAALEAGFRFVWSSALIGQRCQAAQGGAIRASRLARDSLFIAGTVNSASCGSMEDCYQQTKRGAEGQFQTLGFATLDMLMLDYPAAVGCAGIAGQWKAFEELYASGLARVIAVSNFSPEQITCIASRKGAVVPAVNQLHYCVGNAGTMVADNAKFGIQVQSYSPLNAGSLIHDETCKSVGENHGRSSAQVALRWIIQTNGTIATQSTKLNHLKADLDIFQFSLTSEEVARLSAEALSEHILFA